MAEYEAGRATRFALVPWELLDDADVDAHSIAVYAALRRFADFSREPGDTVRGARVSDSKAAEVAGCSPRTFRDRRKQLRELGWIEWSGASGEANRYTVHGQLTPARAAGVGGDPGESCRGGRQELPGGSAPAADDRDVVTETQDREAIEAVFSHYTTRYAERYSEARADRLKLTACQRDQHIRARLREGYTTEELRTAIDGCFDDPWHAEREKDELEYIVRNQGLVERFLKAAAQHAANGGPPGEGARL